MEKTKRFEKVIEYEIKPKYTKMIFSLMGFILTFLAFEYLLLKINLYEPRTIIRLSLTYLYITSASFSFKVISNSLGRGRKEYWRETKWKK